MLYWFLFNFSLKSFGLVVKMSVTLKLDPLTMTYCLNEADGRSGTQKCETG